MHALQTNGQHLNRLTVLQWLPLALALICLSNTASAAEYTIQVGAFNNPDQNYAESLRSYGEVNATQGEGGVTQFSVGRYVSIEAAKLDLNRLADDYPDAFVRTMSTAAGTADVTNSNHASNPEAAAQQNTKIPEAELWESLSDSERRRVVYLDGVLHLKQGDEFIPLADYRRGQGQ